MSNNNVNQNTEVNQANGINDQKETTMNTNNDVKPANGVTQRISKDEMIARVAKELHSHPEMMQMMNAFAQAATIDHTKEAVMNKTEQVKEAVKGSVSLFGQFLGTVAKAVKEKTPSGNDIGKGIGNAINIAQASMVTAKASAVVAKEASKSFLSEIKKGYAEVRTQK